MKAILPRLRKDNNSSTATQVKLCISGLSEIEVQTVQNEIFKNQSSHIELLDGFILHPECTHLLTKTSPGLAKTEKVLSALARGIPIIDIKYFKEFLKQKSPIRFSHPCYIAEYDIGGKLSIQSHYYYYNENVG